MEQKTMGAFIAALRKANGMTQKELAEKLNVSDKSVSRWERDDGAPDLSLIPVIAEIFGVTCDELLRGQRCVETPSRTGSTKGEKQRKRLLAVSLAKYRNRSFIAMGIALAGLIAAMIGNLGFLRAYIGFFAGLVFFVAAVICQAIFINGAFLSVDDDGLGEEETADFRGRVLSLAKVSFGLTLTLFAATLPLVIYVNDTYWGLSGGNWLRAGGAYALAALALWGIVCWYANAVLLKKGFLTMDEKGEKKYRHNRKLLLRCVAGFLVIALVTLLVQAVVNHVFSTEHIAVGIEFEDYDSFVEFMEQDVVYEWDGGFAVDRPEPSDDVTYYDEFGNEISEEEALRVEIVIPDGTAEGKVVCTFIHRNQTVWSWYTSDTEDGLPITAISNSARRTANGIVEAYNTAFAVLYGLELLGVAVFGLRKRMK